MPKATKAKKPSFGDKMKAIKEQKEKDLNSIDLKQIRLEKTLAVVKANPQI